MGRILVTAAGLLAWGFGVVVVASGWSTGRTPLAVAPGTTRGERTAQVVARVAGSVAGGIVAGGVVLGLGSRLLMRVLAATSPDAAQGRLTEAEELVGSVTLGGTIGLIVFVGLFGGVAGAALFGLLRRWLPDRSVRAGLVVAGIGAGVMARPSGLLDPDNRDFALLEPAWLAVLLAVALVVTFGLTSAVLIDRWAPVWPAPGWSVRGVAGVLPLALLVALPPAAVAAVGVIAVRVFLVPAVASADSRVRSDHVARRVVALAGVGGAAWVVAAGVEIIT